ncbi:mRNA 3'-end-processing protein YTH1 [Cladobotryum mycophilum]|uniref:mRNA 3'-end-processing protein YTH1 n=1 Tax=Cladobotryum mycophilum TaxID=491253 RepID=A0ABR0SL36_9HYPO
MATTSIDGPVSSILNHASQPYHFHFSSFLRKTYQVGLSPDRPICKAFQTGNCPNGTRCTERHVSDGRSSTGAAATTTTTHHQQQQQQPTGVELPRVQALASRPVQERRALRVPARVQPT